MSGRLDKPESENDLYFARGEEVTPTRPLMTGDIFDDVTIPGVANETVMGIVVTHPCSMRVDGVELLPSLHVALVEESDELAWASCPRDRMPLPGIGPHKFHVIRFDLLGMVESPVLKTADRIACMAVRGINILQQRLIWYFTRFAAPTAQLNQLFTPVFEEVDMQEEWVTNALNIGMEPDIASREFHNWLRENDDSGTRRQDQLRDPQTRPAVRRSMDAELRSRYM